MQSTRPLGGKGGWAAGSKSQMEPSFLSPNSDSRRQKNRLDSPRQRLPTYLRTSSPMLTSDGCREVDGSLQSTSRRLSGMSIWGVAQLASFALGFVAEIGVSNRLFIRFLIWVRTPSGRSIVMICSTAERKLVSSRQTLLFPFQGKILRKNGNGEQG
jgi:hypothetical protein